MKTKLIGPFSALLTMRKVSLRGPLHHEDIEVIKEGGILIRNGYIVSIGNFLELKSELSNEDILEEVDIPMVAMPGIIDAHTHLIFSGSRHLDYAARNAGKSYLEIAKAGGGIWDTVQKTRKASDLDLIDLLITRQHKLIQNGITTVEIKSGYGLSKEEELRQLEIIKKFKDAASIGVITTCLAAHINPKDFMSNNQEYLNYLAAELLPEVMERKLATRIDIFVEEEAFTVDEARPYLVRAAEMGFDLVVHGDQFTECGSLLAVEMKAHSVDHLEASEEKAITALANADTAALVLPGASIGLGCNMAPARKLLDAGAIVAIASDWNPGSAPMGDLWAQSAILGTYEKLTDAEILAGITVRAAYALRQMDIGVIDRGMKADICGFPIKDYREILYHQGQLKPTHVWKEGKQIL